MEKNVIKNYQEKEEDDEHAIKYSDLLDDARKYIEAKNNKLAQFYIGLANLEPKLDIFSKVKSIGILTFIRHNSKDSQIMDHLIYKTLKYIDKKDITTFDFNNMFCIIRIIYRGGLMKNYESQNLLALYFLRRAKHLFEIGRINSEEASKDTIDNLFDETVEKYKKEIDDCKSLLFPKTEKIISDFVRIKEILKREDTDQGETLLENVQNEIYLISIKWVSIALPFIEEYISSTVNNEEELFNLNKIFTKYINYFEINTNKTITNAYPAEINNSNIIEFKDYWYDYNQNYSYTNIFISKHARENQDFFYLSKRNWDLVKSYFGCKNEILRKKNSENNLIDTHLVKLKILVLNIYLKEYSIDYIRPRYVQISKYETVKDLKVKIIRCIKDHFSIKLKDEDNNYNFTFNKVKLFNVLFGIKKRKREILKLMYSYNTKNSNFIISANQIENDDLLIDDLEYGPGDLIIAEIDGDYIQPLTNDNYCNSCSKKIQTESLIAYCSQKCKENDKNHIDFHNRFNKFHIKKFDLKQLFSTRLEDIIDTKSRFGKVGLKNLGNTCFMNSALQCLSHCEDLTKFFLLKYHSNDINLHSKFSSNGHIANSYYDLIHNLWNSNCEYLSPGDFRHMLIKIVKKFQGFSQQDSHELLTYLLDSLHEDMNRNVIKPYIEMKEKEDNESDSDASRRWWANHLKRENSIIVDLFHGQYKSTIMCPECNKISLTYDPFMYLGLPIPSNQNKFYLKFFPNISKDYEYKYYEIEVPFASNKNLLGKDIKQLIHSKYGERDKNKVVLDYPQFLRYYETAVLTPEKLFKRLMKDDEEVLNIIEKEGEIIVYEKFTNLEQFKNSEFSFSFYINPIIFKEESSMLFFNKTTRNNLFYPLLITFNSNHLIKDIFFEIFKIFRKVLKDERNTDVNKFYNSLKNSNSEYMKKEFDIYFKPEKYNYINFSDDIVPFDLFFLNTIPEPSGFFSSKSSCEFCEEKKCENCRILQIFDLNQTIINISKRIKIARPICLLVKFKTMQKTKFFNDELFPFNLEDLSTKSLISKSSHITLYDCLNLFRTEERLEKDNAWYCSKCNKHQEATKKMEIYKAPNILIIQLKRFRIRTNSTIMGIIRNGKNESIVNYPLEGLEFKDFIVGEDKDAVYDLFAISQHFGSLSSGHYTALCRNRKKWYEFDDESVNLVDEKNVVCSSAYLLFYRKRQKN